MYEKQLIGQYDIHLQVLVDNTRWFDIAERVVMEIRTLSYEGVCESRPSACSRTLVVLHGRQRWIFVPDVT